ncbi:MAG: GMC oxidoreductase [Nannocystaceae bacterium]
MGAQTKPKIAVVGSGFGGAVMACRLAESGLAEVHVFERGARYGRNEFPRRVSELRRAFWDPEDGRHGLFELRSFGRAKMDIVTAAGLGGGSLIYSNVLYRVPDALLQQWPANLRRAQLDPYYSKAERMLGAARYPAADPDSPYHNTPKSWALFHAASKMRAQPNSGPGITHEWPHLAITFGAEPGLSQRNAHGVQQSACTGCGECNIGCNIAAKNTVDLNYLALASARGAKIHTYRELRELRRDVENGDVAGAMAKPADLKPWHLELRDPTTGETFHESFDHVVLAAGAVGTTEILLRLQRGRPQMSPTVGSRFSPNGDLLGFVSGTRAAAMPTLGPVITGAIRFDHGTDPHGQPSSIWVEDGGFPPLLAMAVYAGVLSKHPRTVLARLWQNSRLLGQRLAARVMGRRHLRLGQAAGDFLFGGDEIISHTLPLLAMGRDTAHGQFVLKEDGPRHDQLDLQWSARASDYHYERARESMRAIAETVGGTMVENLGSYFSRYVTVHPLGGAPLSHDRSTGAVDAATGEVFGARGLFVADGSLMPTAAGPNPALTIAALSEYFAQRLCDQLRGSG